MKKRITIRIDKDVLAWFKKHGNKYQSDINNVLRGFMNKSGNPEPREKRIEPQKEKNQVKKPKYAQKYKDMNPMEKCAGCGKALRYCLCSLIVAMFIFLAVPVHAWDAQDDQNAWNNFEIIELQRQINNMRYDAERRYQEQKELQEQREQDRRIKETNEKLEKRWRKEFPEMYELNKAMGIEK